MPEIIYTKEAESGQEGRNDGSATGQHCVGEAEAWTEPRKDATREREIIRRLK